MTKTAGLLKHGDKYPHPLDSDLPPLTVDCVTLTGKKKFGSQVPMVGIYFTDAPKVIKRVEVPMDQEVSL